MSPAHDAVIVGGGHNGLVAATLLARNGWRVIVLEQGEEVGGAAVSAAPFPGHEVRLSRYSYLVSLFPRALALELGLGLELRRRRVSSYTPVDGTGVLVGEEPGRTQASIRRAVGSARDGDALERFGALTARVAERTFGSLSEPLRSRAEFRALVGSDAAWQAFFEAPLAGVLEREFESDVVRGIVATDALIGTFARLDDARLRQNRCFLYHVIGNGTGRWDVPVGGMGRLTGALAQAARAAGAQLRVGARAIAVEPDGDQVVVRLEGGEVQVGRHLLAGLAPAALAGLLGDAAGAVLGELGGESPPEGAQLKLNLLLSRLPRLRDPAVSPEKAFGGTFHINEGYSQLEAAHRSASAGQIPDPVPCEAYCHSLTDPSILSDSLRAAGAQTLTVFALHMPARLFRSDHAQAKRDAVAATLRSIDSVLAEPIEDCLLLDADGEPCLEARTPIELEAELGMPGGHIFHRDLSWPFAEDEDERGRWGVETRLANLWLCSAGARRGGGVSGIPGWNAARAVLGAG